MKYTNHCTCIISFYLPHYIVGKMLLWAPLYSWQNESLEGPSNFFGVTQLGSEWRDVVQTLWLQHHKHRFILHDSYEAVSSFKGWLPSPRAPPNVDLALPVMSHTQQAVAACKKCHPVWMLILSSFYWQTIRIFCRDSNSEHRNDRSQHIYIS